MILLTDIEMAKTQDDKERCLAVIAAFDTCQVCSAKCGEIAKAQTRKILDELDKATNSTDDEAYSEFIKRLRAEVEG